jgi:hypothetical protein
MVEYAVVLGLFSPCYGFSIDLPSEGGAGSVAELSEQMKAVVGAMVGEVGDVFLPTPGFLKRVSKFVPMLDSVAAFPSPRAHEKVALLLYAYRERVARGERPAALASEVETLVKAITGSKFLAFVAKNLIHVEDEIAALIRAYATGKVTDETVNKFGATLESMLNPDRYEGLLKKIISSASSSASAAYEELAKLLSSMSVVSMLASSVLTISLRTYAEYARKHAVSFGSFIKETAPRDPVARSVMVLVEKIRKAKREAEASSTLGASFVIFVMYALNEVLKVLTSVYIKTSVGLDSIEDAVYGGGAAADFVLDEGCELGRGTARGASSEGAAKGTAKSASRGKKRRSSGRGRAR